MDHCNEDFRILIPESQLQLFYSCTLSRNYLGSCCVPGSLGVNVAFKVNYWLIFEVLKVKNEVFLPPMT